MHLRGVDRARVGNNSSDPMADMQLPIEYERGHGVLGRENYSEVPLFRNPVVYLFVGVG